MTTNNLVTTDLELWVVLDDGSHTSHNGHFSTFIARSCCESASPCIMFATCGKHIKSHYRTQTMVDILHALELYLFYMLRQSQAYFVPAFMFLDSLPGRSHQPGSLQDSHKMWDIWCILPVVFPASKLLDQQSSDCFKKRKCSHKLSSSLPPKLWAKRAETYFSCR